MPRVPTRCSTSRTSISMSGGASRSVIGTSMEASPRPRPDSPSTCLLPSRTREGFSNTSRRCPIASTSLRTPPVSRTRSGSPSRAAPTSSRRTGVVCSAAWARTTRRLRPIVPTRRVRNILVCSPARCTAVTDRTGMPMGGAAAGIERSVAPRTPRGSGMASFPMSSGPRWPSRTCSPSACTPNGTPRNSLRFARPARCGHPE